MLGLGLGVGVGVGVKVTVLSEGIRQCFYTICCPN